MERKALLENELAQFVAKIKGTYHPDKIILFGSLANGRVKDNSDLDVIIVASTTKNFWERLRDISPYCSLKVGMDVLFYTPEEFNNLIATRRFFREEIIRKGEVIYDKG